MNRSETYMAKIVCDALDRTVIFDADVKMIKVKNKIKAYCPQTDTYLQFPRELRKKYKTLVADIVKSPKAGTVFYRAYPNSIRVTKDGEPIA